MISWAEYLSSVIEQYREGVEEIVRKEIAKKKFTEEAIRNQLRSVQLNTTFFPPCQIEVIEDKGKGIFFLYVTFDEDRPDKEIMVAEIPEDTSVTSFIAEYSKRLPHWSKKLSAFDEKIFARKSHSRKDILEEQIAQTRKPSGLSWMWVDTKSSLYVLERDPTKNLRFLKQGLDDFRRQFYEKIERLGTRNAAEQIVSDLKEKAGQIVQENVRTDLLNSANAVNKLISSYTNQLAEQEKLITAVKEDVDGVRQLLGVSKEYQDWRVLVSDVDRLKGEHVPREIFDTEVRRIDEKIDKGLKALNTRIEDLKAIKFWSKRTLLEIALAIMTAIAALYGAGVIKF